MDGTSDALYPARSEGWRERKGSKTESDGRKIEMIGETDWWGIRVTGGAIKTVFVFDHQCFHTVPVSSRGQLLTVYVKNESILSLWFMLHPPPPNSTPPPLLPQWPDIPA